MFFQAVPEAPPDAVFGLMGTFKADPRPQKVNLLAGVYKNERLETVLLPSVQKAIEQKYRTLPADYLPIDGIQEFVDALGPVIFGKHWSSKIYGAHAVAGTGALRLGVEFIAREVSKTIYIPQPSWPIHRLVFERAGCRVETYPYYNPAKHGYDHALFMDFLGSLAPKSVVVLHAACHNPTGSDPTADEWAEIAGRMLERGLLPFFDFAYQGLGDGLEEDAAALRHFASSGMEFLVAYSCSKNFSLYAQRVGALYVVSENGAEKSKIASQIKQIIRSLYSSPPAFGAVMVAHILNGPLRGEWEKELTAMRHRLQTVRSAFVHQLMDQTQKSDFRPLLKHRGMFSFIDLEKPQVRQLIDRFGIYMLDNGRINIAGLNDHNLDYVVKSLISVIR